MKNSGKKFEEQFKKSVPEDIFYYRFRDGTSAWGKQDQTRFQAKNICDCLLFDGDYLYLLELKAHKGKSLPLSAIKKNQIDGLYEADRYKNLIAGLVVSFTDTEETYFMPIQLAYKWYYNGVRKSIPISEFREKCLQINSYKKRTMLYYLIDEFIDNLRDRG